MPEPLDCWAVVEVMGRSRYAGKVTEQVIAGGPFVRIDVPAVDAVVRSGRILSEAVPAFTRYIGAQAIFAITPTTENVARSLARQWASTPVELFELREATRPALTNSANESGGADDYSEPPY